MNLFGNKKKIKELKIQHSKDLADLYSQLIVEYQSVAAQASENSKEFTDTQKKLTNLLDDLKYGMDANQLISLNQFVKSFMQYGERREQNFHQIVQHYDKLLQRSKYLTQEFEKKALDEFRR